MAGKGWISVHRKIQSHWVWDSSEPFDKRSAWIDILLLVNHKKNKFLLGNELVEVDKGEKITSERKLAKRWHWSRTKVRNFLELLKKDEMIEFERKPHKRTRLKVLNYGDYQGSGNQQKTSKKPQKNQSSTSKEPVKNLNNNDNNELIMKNNDNNISLESKIGEIYNSLSENKRQLFHAYIDLYRQENKSKEITESKHHRLLAELFKIYKKMKFDFDGNEYKLNEKVFESGVSEIIKKEVANLNYCKKVWISELERSKNSGEQVSGNYSDEEEKLGAEVDELFDQD